MSTTRRVSLGSSGFSNKGRKSSSLPIETVEYLKEWMMSPMHIAHPYPTEQEKAEIMADTGIEMKQLTNWFVNNRKRYWKPRVEAKLKQQAANRTSSSANKTQHVRAHQGRSGVVGALLSEETMEPLSPEPSSTPSKRSTVRRTNSVVSFDMLSTERQGSDNSSKFQSIVGSEYAPAVSEASSYASESASDTEGESSVSGDDRMDEPGYGSDLTTDDYFGSREYVKRLELVDVYVFRPPAGTDAITLDNISTEYNGEEVLKTYYQREISYSFPERNPSKMESKRDAQINRLRKKILKLFHQEHCAVLPASPKRKITCDEATETTPRKKFQSASTDMWRNECQNTSNIYGANLPTLEEAAHLFGYTTAARDDFPIDN